MTATDRQERAAYLAALLARHTTHPAGLISTRVTHLQRLARQAQKAEENYCNVPDYPRDAKMARLRKHADAIAAELGPLVRITLGGDCRGPCAALKIAGDPGEALYPDGYAIY